MKVNPSPLRRNKWLKPKLLFTVRTGVRIAAAFIFNGQRPNTGFLKNYLEMDKYGFIRTGHDFVHDKGNKANMEALAFETSVYGVFAAGDVRHGSIKQVASAVGEGAAASISIRDFLRNN